MKAGWKIAKLGDVCHVYQPETLSQKQLKDGPYPVYGANGQIGFHNEFNHAEPQLTLGCRGTCGVVNWTTENAWINGNAMVVKAVEELVIPQFLSYALKGGINIGDSISGTAQPQITRKSLTPIEIPLPPLAEQKRIVALLDEAFAGIDEAKAKAEDILERTQALFESHLQSIFSQQGHGWVERRLGELSRINYGYTESASSEKVGPHFLRITDIQDDGVDWNTVPYCPIDKGDLPKYKLIDGDIVFARTGATTGKSYLVSNPPDSVFASYLIRVQLSDKALIPGFLYLFFQTRSYWDVIRAGVSGSAQGGFNASKLGELTIPYPASLNDQKAVIHSIAEIQADTLKAGKLSNRKLQALAELRESLLTQAFAGELTA